MRLSIVPALWPGEAIAEIQLITRAATAAGCPELWFSEVNGYDAFSLASGLAGTGDTGGADIVVGPIPLGVRDPALVAQSIASLKGFTSGRVGVALGSSSRVIVEKWHGRVFGYPVEAMKTYIPALAAASSGDRTDHRGLGWKSQGFKLGVPAPGRPHLTIAALGDRMLNLAGALADRVVVNLVTPGMVARMKELVLTGAAEASRPAPPLAVWVLAGSHGYAGRRAGSMLSTYLNAAGYRSRLEEMSMAGLIRTDPVQAVARLGILELAELSERLAELQSAGADEVALVMSGGDPVVDLWIERLAGQGWVTDA